MSYVYNVGPRCKAGRARKRPIHFCVLHHTAGEGTVVGVVRVLNGKNLSYHDILKGGTVSNVYPHERVAYHAGHANEGSIGFSVASRGVAPSLPRHPREEYTGEAHGKRVRFLKLTEEEIDAIDAHCRYLSERYDIPLVLPQGPLCCLYPDAKSLVDYRGFIAHGHVTTRKIDPGPHLLEELQKRWA